MLYSVVFFMIVYPSEKVRENVIRKKMQRNYRDRIRINVGEKISVKLLGLELY